MKLMKLTMAVAVGALMYVTVGIAQDKTTAAAAPVVVKTAPAGLTIATNAGTLGGTKAAPFSAEMSAEFMKKVMETTARLEEVKKQIAARQAELYASNPQIKAYRDEMIKMQTEINAILATDKDLNNLKMSRDILGTTMPAFPRAPMAGGPGRTLIMK